MQDTEDEVEKVRHGKAVGDPAPRPEFFDERYILPVHSDNLILHRIHHHERDDKIQFFEKPHLYKINDEIAEQSISSLAHAYEDGFEPILGIRAMQKSKSQAWPRKDYVIGLEKKSLEDIDVTKGVMIHDIKSNMTMSSINADTSRKMAVGNLLDMLRSVSAKAIPRQNEEFYNFEREETNDEIKQKWEKLGLYARNEGTEAHLSMELWANSLPVRLDDPEVQVGLNFMRKHLVPLQAKVFKTEWEIYGEDECIAGSIDLAVQLPSGDLYLVDWKRAEKLPQKLKGYSKFKEPLSNLEQCNGCTYAMQLSSYQYIIEKYYGFKVAGRCLVSLHPQKPFHTSVPYLSNEVEYIMSLRRAKTSTRRKLEASGLYDDLKCCMTGHLAENAMRDAEGRIYWDKAVQLHEIENLNPCPEIADEVKRILDAEIPNVPPPQNLVPWRTMFPGAQSDLMAFSSSN